MLTAQIEGLLDRLVGIEVHILVAGGAVLHAADAGVGVVGCGNHVMAVLQKRGPSFLSFPMFVPSLSG
eukprot:COSAG06_NODE_149_length_22026_cov_33.454782_28_plen_68_part_00